MGSLTLLLQLLMFTPACTSSHIGASLAFTPKGRNSNGRYEVDFRYKPTGNDFHTYSQGCTYGECGYPTEIYAETTARNSYGLTWHQTELLLRRELNTNLPFDVMYPEYAMFYNDPTFWIENHRGSRVSWRMLTHVDLGTRSDTGESNRSPITTMLPIIRVTQKCPRTFNLTVFDPDGDSVRCRLETYAYGLHYHETCSLCNLDSAFTLDQNSCSLTYRYSTISGYHPIELVVEDFPNNDITLFYSDGSYTRKTPLSVSRSKRQVVDPSLNTTAGPVNATAPPTTTTAGPVNATAPPTTTTARPVNATAPPTTTTAGPVNATAPPTTTTARPVNATAPPTTTAAGPVNATAPPTTTTAGPVNATAPPTTTAARPVNATAPPTTTTAGPVNATAPPTTTTAGPVNATAPPTTTAARPVNATAPPTTTTARPVNATAPPTTTAAGPVNATAPPTTTTARPVNATAPPTTTTARPVNATAPPTTTAAGPVNATAPPTTTTAGPVNATAPPTTTTARPVNATAPPTTTTTAGPVITTDPLSTPTPGPLTTTPYYRASAPRLSRIPLDFTVFVDSHDIPSCLDGDYFPLFLSPTPAHGAHLPAFVNHSLEIKVRSTTQYTEIIDLIVTGPRGFSKQKVSTDSYLITWTPTEIELNEHLPFCFVSEAKDGQNRVFHSELRCVMVDVEQHEATVTCNETTVTVEVKKTPHIKLNENKLHLNEFTDSSCDLKRLSNATHLVAVMSLNACGTYVEEDDDNIVYRNAITSADLNEVISRRHHEEISFSCVYPKRTSLTLGFTHKDPYSFRERGFGVFTFQFEFFETQNFSRRVNPSSYPVQVYIKQMIFMQIEATSSIPNTELFVEACKATPYDNPNSHISYTIMENGCVKDKTVQIYSRSRSQFRFGMEAFEVIGAQDEVYITCSVILCESDVPGTRCSQGCLGSNSENHRSKREAASQTSSHFISQGPLHLIKTSEKTASGLSLNLGANLVFIAGCLLACGVAIYRSRRTRTGYQPLPTFDT